jgi:hypothetical protein
MDFPESVNLRDPMPEPPKHIMSEPDMPHEQMDSERPFRDEPPATAHVSEQVADRISLDSMHNGVLTNLSANFEQDDLDVPAFLRKRNEVM